MAKWEVSNIRCNCKEFMHEVTDESNGELIALHCKVCGTRLPSEKEQERMRQDQLAAQDGPAGEAARAERMEKRLEFNDSFSIYGGRRVKWVKTGWRKRQLLKKYLILFGSAFFITCLLLMLLELTGYTFKW